MVELVIGVVDMYGTLSGLALSADWHSQQTGTLSGLALLVDWHS
jgi:hypothetical protein